MHKQIERIQAMEDIYDTLCNLDDYNEASDLINTLVKYYQSPLWLQDYEADENHLLPEDLKRGVLSQDGIDTLLSKIFEE